MCTLWYMIHRSLDLLLVDLEGSPHASAPAMHHHLQAECHYPEDSQSETLQNLNVFEHGHVVTNEKL